LAAKALPAAPPPLSCAHHRASASARHRLMWLKRSPWRERVLLGALSSSSSMSNCKFRGTSCSCRWQKLVLRSTSNAMLINVCIDASTSSLGVSVSSHPEESVVAACENVVFRPTGQSSDHLLPLHEISYVASVSALCSHTRCSHRLSQTMTLCHCCHQG
jgi:hypothetical protein